MRGLHSSTVLLALKGLSPSLSSCSKCPLPGANYLTVGFPPSRTISQETSVHYKLPTLRYSVTEVQNKLSIRGHMGHLAAQDLHFMSTKRKKEKGAERIFQEIMAEKFPNLIKNMNIRKPPRTLGKMNLKRPTTETCYNQTSKGKESHLEVLEK